MKTRTLRMPVAACVALVVAATLGFLTPAAAAVPAAPVLSNLSTATPGHLTGKVTGSGGTVQLFVGGLYEQDVSLFLGSATFDLDTWGLPSTSTLEAQSCNNDGCSATTQATIHPTDVLPQVTWSGDETVGQAQTIQVTAEDSGGGTLAAFWDYGTGYDDFTVLDKHGTTGLTASNGTGVVTLYRCHESNWGCTPFEPDLSHHYSVLRATGLVWPQVDDVTQLQDRVVHLTADPGRPWPSGTTYDVSWSLVTAADEVVRTGTGSGAFGPTQKTFDIPIVSEGLPDGILTITGTLTVHTTDYGDLTRAISNAQAPSTFYVDRTGPVGDITFAKTHSTIYPRVNVGSYYGSTSITVKSTEPELNEVFIVNSAGATVRTLHYRFGAVTQMTLTWNGKTASGVAVPGGTYRVYPVDNNRNIGPAYTTVVVSAKKLITKTFRKDVSASGSMIGYFVGPCSTLARPSHRGWYRSLGYYANTKCGTQLWHASAVSTVHSVTVPSAARYVDLEVSAYGGPVNGGIADRAVIRYLATSNHWAYERIIRSGVAWHSGSTQGAYPYVTPTHHVRWGFYTAYKNRYDVKSFRITVHYQVVGFS